MAVIATHYGDSQINAFNLIKLLAESIDLSRSNT